MLNQTASFFLHLYSLVHQIIVPCSVPEQLPANSVELQPYLGKWYFKAAVSRREADISQFRVMDNSVFTMEEVKAGRLLLTGKMRIGNNCAKQTWTYLVRPERDDLELEGRPQRRTLLWSGIWVNCSDCIIFQEVEPPLNETGTEDSLNRHMLYSRKSDLVPEVVTEFLKTASCHNMSARIQIPQERAFCT